MFFPNQTRSLADPKKSDTWGWPNSCKIQPASGRSIKLGVWNLFPKNTKDPPWNYQLAPTPENDRLDYLGMAQPGRCELLVSGSVNLSKNPLEVGTMTGCAPWRKICGPAGFVYHQADLWCENKRHAPRRGPKRLKNPRRLETHPKITCV